MSLKTWEINGISLEFDPEDADSMERYENAFDLMGKEENEIPKDGRQSARIRAYCEMHRRLYDRIFGEGTSGKIFADCKDNAAVYDDIYWNFIEFMRGQIIDSAKNRAEKLSKYRPNREQRRKKK